MHADMGLTIVYRSIRKLENYRIEWLKKTVKTLNESQSQKIKILGKFADSVGESNLKYFKTPEELINLAEKGDFNVEFIIEPIIYIFKDYKGVNSLAINMGYNYFYNSKIEEERHDIILNLNMNIVQHIDLLVRSEYGGKRFCYGISHDNLYVANSKEKELKVGSLYFGKPPDNLDTIDEYFWPGFDSSIVYSIFPKNKITLPKQSRPKGFLKNIGINK